MTLLPPNSTKAEDALEATLARIGDLAVDIAKAWDPWTCPLALLPWLAWSVRVLTWDPDWPEATKRAVIDAAPELNRHLGSVWAVKEALRAAGFEPAVIYEGMDPVLYDGAHRYDGAVRYTSEGRWALFALAYDLAQTTPFDETQLRQIRRLAEAAAPVRSTLAGLLYDEPAAEDVGVSDGVPTVTISDPIHYDGTYAFDGAVEYSGVLASQEVWA